MAPRKKKSSPSSRGDLKKELVKELEETLIDNSINPNPLKRQIKLKQFPWTEKQKDFFKIALHPDTKIVFVNGPAGTSKTLLATYCALQLLNMKSISDIMYLRSAVKIEKSRYLFDYLELSERSLCATHRLQVLQICDSTVRSTLNSQKEILISRFRPPTLST